MIHLVMLSGKMGSGKTTLANGLLNHFNARTNWEAVETRFAKVIYDMHDHCMSLMKFYGIDVPEKDGELLQLLGTNWGRKKYGDDVWLRVTKAVIADMTKCFELSENENLLVVISDCRFQNEFDAFPEALRIRIGANEEVRKARCDAWRDNTQHQSEIDLDGYSQAGKFDLYLNSETIDAKGCMTLAAAKIDKGGWVERRLVK